MQKQKIEGRSCAGSGRAGVGAWLNFAPGTSRYWRNLELRPLLRFFSVRTSRLSTNSLTHPAKWHQRRQHLVCRKMFSSAHRSARVSHRTKQRMRLQILETNQWYRRARLRRRTYLRLIQRHLRPRHRSLVRLNHSQNNHQHQNLRRKRGRNVRIHSRISWWGGVAYIIIFCMVHRLTWVIPVAAKPSAVLLAV